MRLPAAFAAVIAVSAAVAVAPAVAKPKLRTFDGTIAVVAKDHKSLRLTRTGKSSVRFALGRSTKVTGSGYTRATLKKGLVVKITARKGKRGYSATKVAIPSDDRAPSAEQPGGEPPGIPYDGPPPVARTATTRAAPSRA